MLRESFVDPERIPTPDDIERYSSHLIRDGSSIILRIRVLIDEITEIEEFRLSGIRRCQDVDNGIVLIGYWWYETAEGSGPDEIRLLLEYSKPEQQPPHRGCISFLSRGGGFTSDPYCHHPSDPRRMDGLTRPQQRVRPRGVLHERMRAAGLTVCIQDTTMYATAVDALFCLRSNISRWVTAVLLYGFFYYLLFMLVIETESLSRTQIDD